VALATKTDLVSKERQLSHLVDIGKVAEELGIQWAAVVPCSAETGENVDVVGDVLLGLLPPGPMYYPDGEITDEPEETLIAELIREAALEGVRDELPHSIAVMIDEILPREGRPEDKPLLDVFATIVVERDSQKGIIIGHQGARLREIGSVARPQINRLLGTRVHLKLHVKVLKEWQRDSKYLNRLGF
jgi:GTP-binding protein Era